MANQRDASRQDWKSKDTIEDINSGSLQRIADACERMAGNYIDLQNEVQSHRKARDYYQEQSRKKDRQISALRGVITRLRKSSK